MLDRTSRLKAAKTDASSEIAAYKQKKEQELKQYEAEVSINSLRNNSFKELVTDLTYSILV